MSLNRIITALFFILFALSAAKADVLEAWQGFSNPDILSSGFTHNYFSLPAEGSTSYNGPRFWSSDYWPSKLGGINLRWNSSRPQGFNTKNYTRDEVLRMSTKELEALAPSEKFDILNARYDYPLKADVARSVKPTALDWEGICHGWVVAAIHHAEPTPKTIRNRDGVNVPFGSADIKALLSYYYAWYSNSNAPSVGQRCSFGEWTGGRENCNQDLNAGAFHIILANRVGLSGEGLVMDIERYDQVWNQPVVAYRSQFLGEFRPQYGAADTAVREFRLSTQIWYVNETENSWNPVQGTNNQKFETKTFQYRVELDAYDRVVGGTWESNERPDFIWQKEKSQQFDGMFIYLPNLLNDY